MQLTDWIPAEWIPAVSSSMILGIIGVAVGTFYKARVEKTIQHKFDVKIEELRSELRKEEEGFKADLRRKDEQISALRSSALSGMSARNSELDKKRIAAIEKVWETVVDQAQTKMLMRFSASLKLDYMLSIAANNDSEAKKMREFADMLCSSFGVAEVKYDSSADKERIFVSPISWALFTAYRRVLAYPVAKFTAMRTGIGEEIFSDTKPLLELIKTALPHRSEYIDRTGTNSLPYLIDELEEKLFSELVASLDDSSGDEKSVQQAAKILEASERAAAATKQKVEVPDVSGLRSVD